MTAALKMPPALDTGTTHFKFTSKVFQITGARFALVGPAQEPRFFVTIGGLQASMSVNTLMEEFHVPRDSEDARLMTTAVRGLKYVEEIRPGDAIPNELIDGKASWSVSSKHRQTAQNRLQVQLLSWLSGKELVITNSEEISNFIGMIENKTQLREAFEAAAVALGRHKKDYESVLLEIEQLSHELAYIEALRDRFAKIGALKEKFNKLIGEYTSDSRLKQEIQRMVALHHKACTFYDKHFAEIDAQTGEVIGALKSRERQVNFIRRVRDELHFITREWDALLARWDEIPTRKSMHMDRLLGDTYRLLANKFATAKSMLSK